MRRLIAVSLLLAGASSLHAQGIWDSNLRTGPQFYSYTIHGSEKISEMAVPIFVSVPVISHLTFDVGTAFANVKLTRTNSDSSVTESSASGITDTQLRANYSLANDLVVVTAGVNVPTGSSTITPNQLDAATRIGSDFLSFPVSGLGSGLGFTGGAAVARSLGSWNVGLAGSVRQSSEYTPFRDAADSAVTFTPGPEMRLRFGVDHPYGNGHVSIGVMMFRFGDDKANAATYNTGNRFVTQLALSNSLSETTDYSLIAWNLHRSEGTLIDGSVSPSSDMTNALFALSKHIGSVSLQPTFEARLVVGQELAKTNALGTVGLRLVVPKGLWTFVPGFAFTGGAMDQGSLTGFRGTLAIRVGN
jgi:hypothetical protein